MYGTVLAVLHGFILDPWNTKRNICFIPWKRNKMFHESTDPHEGQ